MDRHNHYEAAFEAYLQEQGLCYLAVDEKRRVPLGDHPVKSLDFVVFGEEGARLVVDIKGRRFPSGPRHKQRRVWESWATRDDVDGLSRWAGLWGPEYRGLLVFTYHVLPCVDLPDDTEDVWTYRGRRYLLRGVDIEAYRKFMKVRSPRWSTVALPRAIFRSLVRPLHHFTQGRPCYVDTPCTIDL
jgi:hypothetical protein